MDVIEPLTGAGGMSMMPVTNSNLSIIDELKPFVGWVICGELVKAGFRTPIFKKPIDMFIAYDSFTAILVHHIRSRGFHMMTLETNEYPETHDSNRVRVFVSTLRQYGCKECCEGVYNILKIEGFMLG